MLNNGFQIYGGGGSTLDLLVEPSKIRALPSRMVGNWEMCIVQSCGFHEKGACQGGNDPKK